MDTCLSHVHRERTFNDIKSYILDYRNVFTLCELSVSKYN